MSDHFGTLCIKLVNNGQTVSSNCLAKNGRKSIFHYFLIFFPSLKLQKPCKGFHLVDLVFTIITKFYAALEFVFSQWNGNINHNEMSVSANCPHNNDDNSKSKPSLFTWCKFSEAVFLRLHRRQIPLWWDVISSIL